MGHHYNCDSLNKRDIYKASCINKSSKKIHEFSYIRTNNKGADRSDLASVPSLKKYVRACVRAAAFASRQNTHSNREHFMLLSHTDYDLVQV